MELLPEGLMLEAETYNALITTMRRDCRVLESFRIMDYSLLIGVHNLDQSAKEQAVSFFCSFLYFREMKVGRRLRWPVTFTITRVFFPNIFLAVKMCSMYNNKSICLHSDKMHCMPCQIQFHSICSM